MIRKLLGVMTATALVFGAGTALAGNFDPANSVLSVQIGSIPSIGVVAAGGGSAFLTDDGFGGHVVADEAAVWQTTDFSAGTALYTGIPLISNVKITVVNKSGSMQDGYAAVPNPIGAGNTCDPTGVVTACFGGYEPLVGLALIFAEGLQIPVDLAPVGSVAGGQVTGVNVLNNNVSITAMSFVTGSVQITGISTNIVTIPGRGGVQGVIFTLNPTIVEHGTAVNVTLAGVIQELNTVTVNGTNNLLSASQPGMVTLISPIRVNTGEIVGRIPALVKKKFVFVPEPGTMLLLVSGAVGLAVVGRKRMRK